MSRPTPTGVDRRKLLLAGASLPLAACVQAGGLAPAPAVAWSMPAKQAYRTVEHEWVPMRDGVRLSARIWLPEGVEKSPAVLECIPYRKRDLYRFLDDISGQMLAERGIAFVRLDVRGSGESEGVLTDEYSEAELSDCEEAIAWIARQDWCTGAVGMRGLSWGGINTLLVAARRPPALKAIMPMGCCDRRYTDDAHYIGGTLGRTNFQWGVLFKSVMARPPDPAIVGDAWRSMWQARLEAAPSILKTWLEHQREDEYWRRESVAFDRDLVGSKDGKGVPAYLVSGWSDTYQVSVLRLLGSMRGPAKAMIGPWGHTYPNTAQPQGLNWAQEEVRWWKHWLAGEATGIMDEPRLRVFMPYATASEAAGKPIPGRWIAETRWPNAPKMKRYHLNLAGGGNVLGDKPATELAASFRNASLVGSTKPEWLDRLPIEQSHDDRQSQVFDSAVLAEPLEIFGTPEVRVEVASDKPVATLMVRLTEVRPDGSSWLVTWAALNLTRRESMAAPSALQPGKTYTIPISLRTVAYRFGVGSKVRLAISEGSWPMLWPSPATPMLTLSGGVSTLDLPVRAMETAEAPFGVDEVISQAPFQAYQPAKVDADGRMVITTSSATPPYPAGVAGIELSSKDEQVAEVRPDDPTSAVWRQAISSTWKHDAVACRIDASYELSADAANFRLVESVEAFLGGEKIFERRNEASVARDLM